METTDKLLTALGGISMLMFIAGLLLVPWLISRLPDDYFIRHRFQVEERRRLHPLLAWSLWTVRNFVGAGLLLAGIAMLMLPGQGILTMLIGISIMDFPGRHALVERCVRVEKVEQALNWIRRKAGRNEFDFG